MILVLACLGIGLISYGQQDERVSSLSFVEVLNENKVEAIYYFQNNWEVLRKMAIEKEYISSYEFLEITPNEEAPYDFILITTYSNVKQYALREEHFTELIEEKGELKLMNDKNPGEFRKTLYSLNLVKHLF